jgi:hypothetical protein
MAGSGIIKTRAQVENLVKARVKGKWIPKSKAKRHLLLWDDFYYIPTIGEARNMMREACTGLPSYSSYDFDCDDFAFYARGRAGAYAARQKWSNAGICGGLIDAECEWVKWGRHMACWVLVRPEVGKYDLLLVDPGEYKDVVDDTKREAAYPVHSVKEIQNLRTIIA